MNITIDTKGLREAGQALGTFSDRRFRAALATALTRTALAVRQDQQAEMRDVFDRPTRYTLSSLYVKPATAESQAAEVGIKNDFTTRSPISWLRWQIDGGNRTPKAFEKLLIRAGAMPAGKLAVPGKFAKLDAFGNMSTGQLRQILSQLRIEPTRGATTVLPTVYAADNDATRKAKQRRIGAAYRRAGGQFVAFPNGRGKLLAGIYQVRDTAWGRSAPKPVLVFVSRASYEAGRYDFEYVSRLSIERNLQREVERAMGEQMQRWAAAGARRVG